MPYSPSFALEKKTGITPWVVALVAVACYGIFLAIRVVVAGKGNVASLIILGHSYVNSPLLPIKHLPQIPGAGYDGQFYFRLALDPFDLKRSALGITFDTPYRPSRIGYPILVFLLAGTDKGLVPASMVYTNILAIGATALVGSYLAANSKISPWWGLLLAGYFGFTYSVGRDLTEVSGTAFVLAGLLFIRKEKWLLGTAAFCYAVITRETATLVVFGIGLYWLWCHRYVLSPRNKMVQSPFPSYIWIAPAFTYIGWGIVTYLNVHQVGIRSDLAANLYFPLASPIEALASRLSNLNNTASILWLGQAAVWATTQALAAVQYRHSTAKPWEKITWIVTAVISLSLSSEIWGNTNYLRSVSLAWVMAIIILWDSRPTRRFLGAVSSIAWTVSTLPLLLFL